MQGYIVEIQNGCWLYGGIEVTLIETQAKVYRTASAAKAALTRRRNALQRQHTEAQIKPVEREVLTRSNQ